MGAFFKRTWHIIGGGALVVFGIASQPQVMNMLGPEAGIIITLAGVVLQTLGIVKGDTIAAAAPTVPAVPVTPLAPKA